MNNHVPNKSQRAVAIWIMIGVAMLIVQILLGGITRLTGSGLSITEWDVITGTLPPMNEQQWLEEFSKYKTTPQYRLLNSDFNLDDFKSIFFWEWFHRFWGRLIAIAFAIPFIIFLLQKRFSSLMIRPLLLLFLLGALQGAVGWIMVASGLTGDAIYVKPAKLMMHFVLACLLTAYAFWFGLQLLNGKHQLFYNRKLKSFTLLIITILFIQLCFGALMAGHKAAPAAPSWPDINGSFFPAYVLNPPEGLMGIMENRIVIHFIHRMVAYLLVILIFIWAFRVFRLKISSSVAGWMILPPVFVLIQLALGIFSVLTSLGITPTEWNRFEWMALLHQLTAILLLLSLVYALFFLSGKQKANYGQRLEPELI